jgi:serine/threonine-protein kinase
MEFVHSYGEMGGELKPGNILLEANDHAKLRDFAMCRGLESASNLANGVGIPQYVASELADGECMPAADAYSFGLILFELVIGIAVWNIDS